MSHSRRQINGAYAGAAVLTAIDAEVRRTATVAGLALAASVASGVWHHNLGRRRLGHPSSSPPCSSAPWRSWPPTQKPPAEPAPPGAHDRPGRARAGGTGRRAHRRPHRQGCGRRLRRAGSTCPGATSAMVLSLDADDVLRTLTWHGRTGSGARTSSRRSRSPATSRARWRRARASTCTTGHGRRSWPRSRPGGVLPHRPQPAPVGAAPRRDDVRPAGA